MTGLTEAPSNSSQYPSLKGRSLKSSSGFGVRRGSVHRVQAQLFCLGVAQAFVVWPLRSQARDGLTSTLDDQKMIPAFDHKLNVRIPDADGHDTLPFQSCPSTDSALLGSRRKSGSRAGPALTRSTRSVIHGKVRSHSEKPEEAYREAERLMPKANRLDLFSRTDRKGWTAWGDETGKFGAAA